MGSRLLEEKEMRFLTTLPLPRRGCVAIVALVEETVGFPAYRQAGKVLECGLLGMANRCLWIVESHQGYGASESHM
jgi:hypothetical protein